MSPALTAIALFSLGVVDWPEAKQPPGGASAQEEAAEDEASRRARLQTLARETLLHREPPCVSSDAHGHPFATCFDPWRALEVSGGAGVGPSGFSRLVSLGVRLRGNRTSRQNEDATWLALHRLAALELRSDAGQLGLSALGYQGLFRRHLREGALLLPTNPPVRVPFPLDISLLVEAARVEYRAIEGDAWALEVVRASVLFDPLRSASGQVHLAVGPTAAYRLRFVDRGVQHDVTPLTALTLALALESNDGLWVARGMASAGWTLTVGEPALTFRARSELELSRVLLAVNEHPLAVFVRGQVAVGDAGARRASDWAVTAGVQVRLFSARH